MCRGCWEEYGSPKVDNEKVRKCVFLIHKVYRYNLGGGALHIVLDDYNISTGYVDDCKEYITDIVEEECINYMLTMTLDEMVSAVSLYHGYWKVENFEYVTYSDL